jgi:hypothetical protein
MIGLLTRAGSRRRKRRAPRDPQDVFRAFVRTLEILRVQARGAQGGGRRA